MIDWAANATHTYEFWEVNPETWRDRTPLATVTSCTITRDDSETIESAELSLDEEIETETYIREYLVVTQPPESTNTERVCLGTHLVQTPTLSYNGKRVTRKLTCYSPLIELKDSKPPIGYTTPNGANIANAASQICRAHCRAPIQETSFTDTLPEPLVANDDDSWLTYLIALLKKANMELELDPYGRISFVPTREVSSLLPAWEYSDNEISILMPQVDEEYDWYGVPNVYEATVSKNDKHTTVRVVNDSESSPLSTVVRGREVVERDSSPDIDKDDPTQDELTVYAKSKLKELSQIERTLEYEHGYNPVRLGDGVLIDYTRHRLNARAKVVEQRITCSTACTVKETAKYTVNLWGAQ